MVVVQELRALELGYNDGQMWKRLKQTWNAYKNVAAVRGFLLWVGWWQTALALLAATGVWLWTHFAHLRGPEQFVLVLVAFAAMLGIINLMLRLRDRSKQIAAPHSLPTPALALASSPVITEVPSTRPQLFIKRWGQIDEATFTEKNKGPYIVQHGFFSWPTQPPSSDHAHRD